MPLAEDGEGLKLLIEVYRVNYAWASLTLSEKRRKKRCGGHVTNERAVLETQADIFDNLARSILGDLTRDLAGSDHLQFCIANDFLAPGCQITC